MRPSLVLCLTLAGTVAMLLANQINGEAVRPAKPTTHRNATLTTSSVKKINNTRPVLRNFNRRFSSNLRSSKFPIIPPRLRLKGNRARTTRTPETTPLVNFTTVIVTTQPSTTLASDPLGASVKLVDLFELSSSDNSPSVAWPFPRRPASRRLWSPTPTRATLQPLPKLLLPRPTRPAMYSLDGFVPKPSIVRTTTTEAPTSIKRNYANAILKTSRKRENGRYLSEELSKPSRLTIRKRLENKESNSAKPLGPFTAFARKGIPGQDYPIYGSIPATDFACSERSEPGMYADPSTGCQIWHMCPGGTRHIYSFMCPNGTIFNEARGICDWWYNVFCDKESTSRRRFGRDVSRLDFPWNVAGFGQGTNQRIILTDIYRDM